MTKIPDGYHSVTPYLMVSDVLALIEFVERVFGAVEIRQRRRILDHDRLRHARVRIGDSVVMLGEAGAQQQSEFPAMLYLYLDDAKCVERAYQAAIAWGARSLREPAEQSYGDYNAGVQDPFGNQWWIAAAGE